MSPVFESLTGLVLLEPRWLFLLLLLPLPFLLAARRARRDLPFAPGALLDMEDAGSLPRSLRSRLLFLPPLLHGVALVLLVLALARPAERHAETERRDGIDILLCLDRSSSMTAHDLDRGRTRLEVARDAAAAFIRGRPDDRIGLVTFARWPDVACPPTRDHGALLRLLAGVESVDSDGPEDATGIGAAVARGAGALRDAGSSSRVVILLTDGEENVALPGVDGAIAPVHAAQLCLSLGVKVHAVLAGDTAAGEGGAAARIDTTAVERLAARTGGLFREARDAAALEAVYGEIDALERDRREEPRWRFRERFSALVVAAAALALAGAFLATGPLRVMP